MTAQLIIQDFGGAHAHSDGTSARLIKGASWKKQRIVVIVPADAMLPAKVALALWNLAFPPNNGVVRVLAQGMEVGEAYSTAIDQVLAHPDFSQWEYVLTVEHDNLPPFDGLIRLLERMDAHPEYAAIGGLYFTKGPEGVAQIWGDPTDPVLNFRPLVPKAGELIECCGTGMGFTLYRLKMFKDQKLRRPWFKTLAGTQGLMTQDLYFWQDARKAGYRCAIDCGVTVGHLDTQTDIIW